jgi:hypothetical protein
MARNYGDANAANGVPKIEHAEVLAFKEAVAEVL